MIERATACVEEEARGGRVLVYVVAYEAEAHLCEVFARIPQPLLNSDDVHFLVSDDCSTDHGPSRLRDWLTARGIENVSVVRTPSNQRYGGNQKLGYRFALEAGFDFVLLLHGDGQYAPELLVEMIDTWRTTGCDVLLGTRMHSAKSALAGGMPLYKLVGNRVLTMFQNALTGLGLSEYHTGYRGYSAAFLRSVPFEVNTNEFHFDTEMLLQAAYVGASIIEVPIPTRYAGEVCRVPGLRYAWNVVRATVQYRLHTLGMLCSLKLRRLTPSRYRDKTTAPYSSHSLALRLLTRWGATRVLDLGCGPGHVSRLCVQRGMEVTGVDRQVPHAGAVTRFIEADLETDGTPVPVSDYDAVLLLDVLEHLSEPEQFLLSIRNNDEGLVPGRPAPPLIVSTPNVAFFAVRINLLFGRFNYAERGILDITHKRLMTRSTLLRMLRDCGYDVERVIGVGVPAETVLGGWFGRVVGWVSAGFAAIWPQMFSFQTLVVCRPRPGVRHILQGVEQVRPTAVLAHGLDRARQTAPRNGAAIPPAVSNE